MTSPIDDTSSIDFFPIDSQAFLENITPNYVMDEKLLSAEWLGDEPLIITTLYEFENFGKDIQELWQRNVKLWEYKTSTSFEFIVKPYKEITNHELANNSFLIYGWPDNIAKNNLIKIEDGRIIIGENSYSGEALQLSIVFPSPFNRARFVAIAMTSSSYYGGIEISEVGGYCLTRDNYRGRIEKGCLDFDDSGNAIGFKWRKQYPEDNRWLYTVSENHILCVRPDSHAQRDIEKLINIHETAYRSIVNTLKIHPKRQAKILCFVHQIDSKTGDPGSGDYCCANGTIHTIYNDDLCTSSYAGHHELVHALTHRFFGIAVHLFGEGLATLMGTSFKKSIEFYAAELLYLNDLVPLTDLLVKDTFKSLHFSIAFMQSASFVKYLISYYGWRRFIHLYKASVKRDPAAIADFFHKIYNKPLVGMEKEWKAYIATFLSKNRAEIVSDPSLCSARRNFSSKDYSAALSYIEDYLKKNTNDPEAYWMAGKSHFSIGNLEKSIEAFLKVIALPSEEVVFYCSSYLSLGRIHDLIGERDVAVNYYKKVLEYPEYNDIHDLARQYLSTPYSQG